MLKASARRTGRAFQRASAGQGTVAFTPAETFSTPVVDFNDAKVVFAAKASEQLLKSWAILSSCRIKALVQNSRTLLDGASAILGPKLTSKVLEKTYFDHFCLARQAISPVQLKDKFPSGHDEVSRAPKIASMRQSGIMPILNYAAEDDVSGTVTKNEDASEATRDVNAARGMNCILTCSNGTHKAFVALKVSGLGDPDLLVRMTKILKDAGGQMDRGHSSAKLDGLMNSKLMPGDLKDYRRMRVRLANIAETASRKGNARVLFDAEPTTFQPAIDALIISMQQEHNQREAVIMNTYQCYLKDSYPRVVADLQRSLNEGWHWGAKLVRGAYMLSERQLAQAEGRASPIQDTMDATNRNYNRCVRLVLEHVAKEGPELMVATHNQQSVEAALSNMLNLGIQTHNPRSGVYFGQLLGMADNLTYPLGAHGYNAYKMCAFGEVFMCTNFLIRRAVENSDALGGCGNEIGLIRSALLERLWPPWIKNSSKLK